MFDQRSSGAVPITPVTKASLPQWLDAHPARREWLNITGFKAEPNSFVFLPALDGEPMRALAAVGEGEPVWAFAGLPTSLPEGVYSNAPMSLQTRLRIAIYVLPALVGLILATDRVVVWAFDPSLSKFR